MATNWYYRIVGEEFGPVDFDALFELARDGGLGPDDDVRTEDADEWQPASTIVGLFPDEDEPSPDLPAADAPPDADDLSSLLESVADDSGASEVAAENARNQWFARVFNQELGPLDFEAVAQMADDGELAPGDLVRCGVDSEWIPAEQIVGLFPEPEEGAATADSASPAADDDPDRIWYYRIADQEHGPLGFGQVMELAAAGTIAPETEVRAGRVGAWMEAGSIVGLFPEPEEQATDATALADSDSAPIETEAARPPRPRRRADRTKGTKKKTRRRKKRQPVAEKDLEEDVVSWLSDDIDDEINRELEQRPDPAPASAPVAEAPVAPPPSTAPTAAPPTVPPPTPSSASAASAALTAAVDAASTSSSRTFTPPPKTRRAKPSLPSFKFNVSMPDLGIDPKQLVVLGVLGLVLLYIFFPFESNPAPEYYDETRAIVDRIMPLYSAKAPAGEWAPVVTEVQPRVTELAEELDKLASAKNPAMQQLLAIHRDYLPPVLEGKSDTPDFVFRRVTQTLDLAGKHINREPMAPATPPPVAENAEATAAAE